ncbi:MAG: serine hydrolase family protein [Candidatus Levybacteria bacterium]|nr:serine hydrolase family protein [Candidatus Levybacteria bacterium]
MKNAVIIHGWGANSESNWFPWLANELEQKGWRATVPDFPNSENPILTEWLEYFQKNVTIDQDSILIGHSLGVPFILRLLEQSKEKIKAAFLVSGFERSLTIVEIENFVNKPFDWEKIKSVCKHFVVINSDNDPYIPLSIGKDFAKHLDTKLIVEHNAGHINDMHAIFAYPRLRDRILALP